MASATSNHAVAVTGTRRLVLWFRNDLRLRDNPLVHEAVQRVKSKEFDDVRTVKTMTVVPSSNHRSTVSPLYL